ncbi:protein disabled isoform X2 [Aethina tumida]|uniref:protein disabled isoform X2 n=1 Tax=Aethina tumida TaxID=116153 RepID=UPI00214807F4|nr:protein disabled isoform X2 [Aethina tumida]
MLNNDKNETTRFLGDGVSFKAKLIGILEVSEARGDRMCQEALSDLKMAIRAAGEHKQRITINIAIDGLRLRDEKTGDSLYHHPVHKISFIAQDMTDSRAFGYIFGSPDTGHRFFGIKTDKAASQVVIAMRDLFQVVFALKKKEIELAKQHLEKTRYPSPIFSDSSSSSKLQSITPENARAPTEAKCTASALEVKKPGAAVADLVDLELELNSLQQGLNQMERITPSDPFGSKDDPFGDSFISYPKPILPPPPSSGRERSSRTSESSSVFSPKTPHTSTSETPNQISISSYSRAKSDFSFSQDEPGSGDWFTPGANSLFEDSLLPEPTKDERHEIAKQEIMSQFDVFTELDPLGTGRSKPYIDKKHFFQELKNPPKKVLNDLVNSTSQSHVQEKPMFNTSFNQVTSKASANNMFGSDPFGEDPFVKEDPFAETDFSKQDPFETEFNDFKLLGKNEAMNNLDQYKCDTKKYDSLHSLLQSSLIKSPKGSTLEKQASLAGTSPRSSQFTKQNTFDVQFERLEEKKINQLSELHENPSLDMSSESECAPEPPPRPAATLMQIKPPPLPPKKQNDLTTKPPPRPPHTEDPIYDYMDNYETAPNSLEYMKNIEKSPPLPVPARKSKFDSNSGVAPERPKKQFNVHSSEEDYLTPVVPDYLARVSFKDFEESVVDKDRSPGSKRANNTILLPPPQRSSKKQLNVASTVASFLESKPNLTTSMASDKSLEGLDITLSQLTLSGLNELATKLNIPPSQLSNMTLVQLTNYLSNFIKSKSTNIVPEKEPEISVSNSNEFPSFQADFAANFNNLNNAAPSEDRYAVFRELMAEEIKQTKIDTEPEQLQEEKLSLDNNINSNTINMNVNAPSDSGGGGPDKYAALREIEIEFRESDRPEDDANENEDISNQVNGGSNENLADTTTTNDMVDLENKLNIEETEKETTQDIIEYEGEGVATPVKSPRSPIKSNVVKSPIPSAITEIVQNNTRLTSGSLSDVISGSSPEVDNTGSNSEKKNNDAAGESWAIFDQANIPVEPIKEKQQSEEGVSPWSSDSKEFGNGSPSDWKRGDSGSGGDQWSKKRRDQEGWWDTSAEPEVQYYPNNRRSTDSYDDEYYECYERPQQQRRRRPGNWESGGRAAAAAGGGHSSSSRDVSPWEEEPRRREPPPMRESRESRGETRGGGWNRHPRQPSFERHRDRRHTDSWDDEEDDYEYEDENFHWSERHGRDTERDRHSTGSREHDNDRWTDDWSEDRRHRRRRDMERSRERWCCPDYDQDKLRYGSGRWSRDRKHDERYYSRDSQESPWEDDYSNDPDDSLSPHYLSARRNWKQRPSSASEMDRKTGEIKSRHYLGTGGSDGERDRRYKGANRRSRSRDSQYSEPPYRHKSTDVGSGGMLPRNTHRTKPHHSKPPLEMEFSDGPPKKQPPGAEGPKLDTSNKKSSTLSRNKKTKDSPKTEINMVSTFPRKSTSRAKSLFENDFVPADDSPVNPRPNSKFSFENDFETSEAESPTISRPVKGIRQQSMFEKGNLPLQRDSERSRGSSFKELKLSPRYATKAKSLFEDDFSPTEKAEQQAVSMEDNNISSIKEETDINEDEEEDTFATESATATSAANNGSRKKKLLGGRLSNSRGADGHLKKSESVNIFARESDPFDDDFFSGGGNGGGCAERQRNTELRWTEDFDDFDNEQTK